MSQSEFKVNFVVTSEKEINRFEFKALIESHGFKVTLPSSYGDPIFIEIPYVEPVEKEKRAVKEEPIKEVEPVEEKPEPKAHVKKPEPKKKHK